MHPRLVCTVTIYELDLAQALRLIIIRKMFLSHETARVCLGCLGTYSQSKPIDSVSIDLRDEF